VPEPARDVVVTCAGGAEQRCVRERAGVSVFASQQGVATAFGNSIGNMRA